MGSNRNAAQCCSFRTDWLEKSQIDSYLWCPAAPIHHGKWGLYRTGLGSLQPWSPQDWGHCSAQSGWSPSVGYPTAKGSSCSAAGRILWRHRALSYSKATVTIVWLPMLIKSTSSPKLAAVLTSSAALFAQSKKVQEVQARTQEKDSGPKPAWRLNTSPSRMD